MGAPSIPPPAPPADPKITDGNRLLSYQAQRAKIMSSTANSLIKHMIIGDSWAARNIMSIYLAALYAGDSISPSGNGYISMDAVGPYGSVGDTSQLRGAVLTYNADWTLNDASGGSATGRNALDGNVITTSTATATFSLDTFYGETFYLYYRQKGGSFRWRIDGGSWTTVTTNTGNARTTLTVSGLSAVGTHLFEIDTTVNSGLGQVWIEGAYATSPTVSGVEISKAGNGGSTSTQWAQSTWLASQAYYMNLIQPHVVWIVLNTNDQRLSLLPSDSNTSMESIVTNIATTLPYSQIVIVGPPENGAGTGTYPMSAYNAIDNVLYKKYAYVEYARFDQLWSTYAVMNGQYGLFNDTFHLNGPGMQDLVQTVYSRVMLP